ncbi:DNA double-strand break repair nuclease NurA [Archaeoglobus sp.]
MEDLELFIYPPAFLGAIGGVKKVARSEIREKVGEIVKASRELRENLRDKIKTIGKSSKSFSCIGIDSTWTSPHLELLYGDCALILYGCLGSEIREVRAEPVVYTGDDFSSFVWKRSIELERELATEILEKVDTDLLIFDGNIFPFPMVYAREWGEWVSVADKMRSLISLAEKKGVSLVGVVKRARSRYLSYVLGREAPTNDKLLASIILENGEYVSLGRFGDFLPDYLKIVHKDKGEDYIRRFKERCKELPLDEVELVFYKTKKPTQYDSATKVEILDLSRVGADEIVKALAGMSTDTGFPVVIDWIDEIVRNEHRVLAFLRDLLEKELMNTCSNEEKEIIIKLCGFMNPQKSPFRF